MRIRREMQPRSTIEEFATRHGLVMVVRERPHHRAPGVEPIYAQFENAEVIDGICLVGSYGNGHTEAEAIRDYAKKISGKRLAINAWRPGRVELDVPILVPTQEKP